MRVLRVLTRANIGGPMRQALALWQEDAAVDMQTLLAVGACGSDETEMAFRGVPEVVEASTDAHGIMRLRRLGRAARPWRDLGATGELRALIRRVRPDVVHTHTSQAGFFGRRAAFAERVPVVAHTFHGHVLADYYAKPVTALFRRLEARLARRTDRLLAVSPTCRDEIHGLGIGDGRIEVVPPAVDLAPFAGIQREEARRTLGLSREEFAIGLVGRLVSVKQPAVFADLVASMPDVRGLVFGSGPLAARLAGRSRLRLEGAHQEMHRVLSGLDALVLCSRREGCPLVALEAFAAGVPVVGFDVPGVRDVLTGWGNGLLVPASAGVVGLADAVSRLRSDSALRSSVVAAARKGLHRFAPRAVAATLRGHYAGVGNTSGVPASR